MKNFYGRRMDNARMEIFKIEGGLLRLEDANTGCPIIRWTLFVLPPKHQ